MSLKGLMKSLQVKLRKKKPVEQKPIERKEIESNVFSVLYDKVSINNTRIGIEFYINSDRNILSLNTSTDYDYIDFKKLLQSTGGVIFKEGLLTGEYTWIGISFTLQALDDICNFKKYTAEYAHNVFVSRLKFEVFSIQGIGEYIDPEIPITHAYTEEDEFFDTVLSYPDALYVKYIQDYTKANFLYIKDELDKEEYTKLVIPLFYIIYNCNGCTTFINNIDSLIYRIIYKDIKTLSIDKIMITQLENEINLNYSNFVFDSHHIIKNAPYFIDLLPSVHIESEDDEFEKEIQKTNYSLYSDIDEVVDK